MPADNIQYLRRDQIDTTRWDHCIDTADNGLVYAYSIYLDHLAKHWDALVLNDYEAVIPLTWNKKYFLHYLYQPAFAASLGIFGKGLTEELVQQFVQAIPRKFKLIEIELNQGNIFSVPSGFSLLRTNYVLNLQTSYEALYNGYRDNIRRNIRKSQQLNCRYMAGIPVADVIRLSKAQLQQVSGITDTDYVHFEKLFGALLAQGKALACGVYATSGELIASCVYFFSHKRAYYIMVGNHPNGRTAGASHYLIDRFIHAHAGQDLLLDFEGSDLRNLAFFYGSFGAEVEIYPSLRINHLPWWVRPFKQR